MISQTVSLADHLLAQIGLEDLSSIQSSIAEEIVHNINSDGFLEISVERNR